MPDIEIRQAVPGDAAVVVALLRSLALTLGEGEKFRSTEAAILRHGFGAERLLWSMLAMEGMGGVGLACYFPTFSTTRGLPGVYVQDLYVAPEARGRGLGRRLLAAVSRDAEADWGAAYLTLLVLDGNSGARTFYRRLGFVLPDNERPAFLDGAAFAALGEVA
jgi:GNAT superfamily N-acetyltransferase